VNINSNNLVLLERLWTGQLKTYFFQVIFGDNSVKFCGLISRHELWKFQCFFVCKPQEFSRYLRFKFIFGKFLASFPPVFLFSFQIVNVVLDKYWAGRFYAFSEIFDSKVIFRKNWWTGKTLIYLENIWVVQKSLWFKESSRNSLFLFLIPRMLFGVFETLNVQQISSISWNLDSVEVLGGEELLW